MSTFVELLSQYIDNLQVEGDFATGKIDTDEKYADFRAALKNYGYNFTIRSSRKESYSSEGKNSKAKTEVTGENENENKKNVLRLPGRGSLMFKSSSDVSVPFFGSPFIVETTIYFTCSQGIKYYGSKKYPDEMFIEGDPLSKKRRRPKLTQKIGCQARMTVKKIKIFTGDEYIVARDNWREKKVAIDLLRRDFLADSNLESLNRYCIVLSLDISHNHEAKLKTLKRPKQSQFDPARKVLKLHEQFQEALVMLNSELITKCTNITTLTSCCTSLKGIINQLRESIEKEDGVPLDLITAAIQKLTQKQLRSAAILEKKTLAAKRKQMKTERIPKVDTNEIPLNIVSEGENNENNQVIEIPNVIEGAQVIWDPVNVSWVQDGQIVLQEASAAGQKSIKDAQSILVQRRADEVSVSNTNQNIGVITQGGQNYAIFQQGTNVHIPNLGVSVPLTMAKVVHPTTILASNVKKTNKRNDVGVTAIAIPAGVEWNQQNWGQITQVVSGDGTQFTNCPTQTIWNITQATEGGAPGGPPGVPPGTLPPQVGPDGEPIGGPRTPQQIAAQKRLQQTQAQVDEVVDIMKTNVEKVLERDQKLSELDDRADALQQGASQFEQQAGKLKRKFWLQNLKMMIIMGVIGLVILAIIVAKFMPETPQQPMYMPAPLPPQQQPPAVQSAEPNKP